MYDSDTKLVHFGYREYDPFTGKWSAEDPLLFGGGDSNLYGYVLGDPVNVVDSLGLFPSLSTIWKNRPFIWHYFFGGGRTMHISPKSDLGRKIRNHLNDLMKKRFEEAISHACEDYQNTTIDRVNFTNNPDLFSLGDSSLTTKVHCGNGKCLIRYEVNDWFKDARDIHDITPNINDEYPMGRAYPIQFSEVMLYGF